MIIEKETMEREKDKLVCRPPQGPFFHLVLTKKKKKKKKKKMAEARSIVLNEKKMEVCNLCGAFLAVGETARRTISHLEGKRHIGKPFFFFFPSHFSQCAHYPLFSCFFLCDPGFLMVRQKHLELDV